MSKPISKARKLFSELKREIFKVVLLKTVLNSAIFFLALGTFFALLTIRIKHAFPITGVFFILNFLFTYRAVNLKVLEQRNKELKDILSTAVDNQDEQGFMMHALIEELTERLKKVSSGTLVDPKSIFFKTLSISILCFTIIFVSSLNINISRINVDLPDISQILPEDVARELLVQPEQQLNESTQIFGEVKVATLGNNKLDLELASTLSSVDIERSREEYKRTFIEGDYITDIHAVQDTPSQERVPKEAELALKYNERIKKLG
ncbi:hypothetical protein D6774_04530 [Candidatus Woesearchaeota archaeon]|nr:MAG: hypothetical protein D6774_04530 [Candidatus Woesearchaeota archaeon]